MKERKKKYSKEIKNEHKKGVFIVIAIWLILISGFVVSNEFTMRTGREVLLKTSPIDPRDLLRGDYVILNYDISMLGNEHKFKADEKVFVVLKIDEKNIATVDYIDSKYPKDKFFIKGTVRNNGWRSRLEYGIESYFIKENTGRELEHKMRNGAYVKVMIDKNGNAKIKELIF